jgi:hypothetical protein
MGGKSRRTEVTEASDESSGGPRAVVKVMVLAWNSCGRNELERLREREHGTHSEGKRR